VVAEQRVHVQYRQTFPSVWKLPLPACVTVVSVVVHKKMQLRLLPRARVQMLADDNNDESRDADPVTCSDSCDGGTKSSLLPLIMERSPSIPLPKNHVARTRSEVQLCLDTEEAKQRDLEMFYRLVNGIRARQSTVINDTGANPNALADHLPPTCPDGDTQDQVTLPSLVRENVQGLVGICLEEGSTTATKEAESWSITGFDSAEPALDNHEGATLATETTDDICDDADTSGVFVLDL
jgi:hypothetical protein